MSNKRTDSVIINGQTKLNGTVNIQGSKNAALPILAATTLFDGKVKLYNVPDLEDIHSLLSILEYLGATYTFEAGVVELNCANITSKQIPDELSTKLRASSLLLGPLLARFGEAQVAMPGGCKIGTRPMDIHFKGFEKLGASVKLENGLINTYIDRETTPLAGDFTLDMPSVGATENLVSVAVYNDETVTLRNFAKEPEVMDLVKFLQAGGADIQFSEDHSSMIIKPVKQLKDVEYTIQPDRIEAGTFLFAALATKGSVKLLGVIPEHLAAPLEKLRDMGAEITVGKDTIELKSPAEFKGTNVKTDVYPGFPTDLQSPMGVLMTQASTHSTLIENVYENRFTYIDELLRMNGQIRVDSSTAIFEPSKLSGCRVEGYDLRGSASMIIAGLVANGVTHVSGLHYLYRGYEALVEKLKHLGADICYE